MFKGTIKKWAVVSIFILTFILAIFLGFVVISYLLIDVTENDPSILLEPYKDLLIIIGIAVFSGIMTVFKRSIVAMKLFCACLVILATLYLYSCVPYLLRLIPHTSILFIIVGWLPFLLGIFMYMLLVKLLIKKKADGQFQ